LLFESTDASMSKFLRLLQSARATGASFRFAPNPWVVLALGAALALAAWWETDHTIRSRAEEGFVVEKERTQEAIVNRMQAYQQVLTAGASFFAVKEQVSRADWAVFVAKLRMSEQYPGIQGTAFAQHLRHADKAKHIAQIRATGLSEYDVRPPGDREEYVVILYIEPFVGRNQRVVGFDMYSNDVRRMAIEQARDTGVPSMSGKVVLAGEKPEDKPPGFVMYMPVYERAKAIETTEDRQAALRGFVFAPFRMHDLMSGILGRDEPAIRFAIFDGESESAEAVLYDSAAANPGELSVSTSRFRRSTRVEIAGRTWTLQFTGTPAFEAAIDRGKPLIVLLGGMLIALLMAAVAGAARLIRYEAQRFRDFAELGSDWFWEQDEQLRFTYVSPRVTEAVGVRVDELIGRTRRDIVGPIIQASDDTERHLAALERHEPFKDVEVSAVGAAGEARVARLSGKPVIADSGAFAGYRGVGRDITVERQRESELDRTRTEAEAASRAKSDFLAMMSHEICTPMTAIIGMGGLLRDTTLDAEQRQYVDTIRTAGDALLGLTNNVLDLSKLEAGQMEFEESRFDILSLSQGIVDLVRPTAEAKSVRVDLVPSPGMPRLFMGDSGRIRQIMLNLAANAVKFTDKGSVTIGIAVARRPDNRHDVRVEVTDTGIGIDPKDVERLFQRFSQVGTSIARRFGGTGLGLSIARELVHRMGGDIGVSSVAGQGSRFWFVLPLMAAEAPRLTVATNEGRQQAAARKLKVLIAEDSPTSQKFIQIVVEAAGHSTKSVSDGELAVAATSQEAFDVILMDVQMPSVDGFEATRRIRARGGHWATVPIIAMTANVLPEVMTQCSEAGMTDYIAKPFQRDMLEHRLARIASRPASPVPS
jgi:PAS domain S-box-containing protein